MDIRQVHNVLAVAASGSFSAAADDLYLSQSSLSKQVQALEAELGVQLFDRSRRRITITPAGEVFVRHGRVLAQTYADLLAELAAHRVRPRLAIVAIPVIAQYGITTLVAHFRAQHPEIDLVLEEREAGAILPALRTREFDLAFVRDAYLDRNELTVREVARDRLCAVLPAGHRLAGCPLLALRELADDPFVVFDKGTVVHEIGMEACRAAGFAPHVVQATLRVESLLGLVASGVGVAVMMEQVVRHHNPAGVTLVALEEPVLSTVWLAGLKSRTPTLCMRQMFDFVERATAQSAA
jgi:DNA-binding transcriptional LysR family regulator